MKKLFKVILFVCIYIFSNIFFIVKAEQIFIDTVYSVIWGNGQNFGRTEEYFPNNIFGPPSSTATMYVPEDSEEELCSLGKGGEIVVGCKNHYIVNGPGVDFIIFENVFVNSANTKTFVEPAIVSVSQDGVNFIEFKFDMSTFEGLAGINWTNGGNNPFDYSVSGGDGFDLSDVMLDTIKYIKIKDTSDIASKIDKTHPYYSPVSVLSGFDLDAVAILYAQNKNGGIVIANNIQHKNPVNIRENKDSFLCNAVEKFDILVFDIYGNKILEKNNINNLCINKNSISNAIYFLIIRVNNNNFIYKFIKNF